jgi:hypothetical protein
MPSKILDTLTALDAERDAEELRLKMRVAELEQTNRELRELLVASTDLSSRHTAALGFLIDHLRGQGLGREQIDALTLGALRLGRA